jgi:spore coat protein CotH
MSTLKVNTLTDTAATKSVPIEDVVNGVARAWVNFNGTGTVAIRASYNVSSITDNGTGKYTINFANAMSTANYAIVGISTSATTTNVSGGTLVLVATAATGAATKTTTAVQVGTGNDNNGSFVDVAEISVAIFV